MQFVQKIFYVHFKLTASDSFKFFFQAVRNCRWRVPLLQHLPNPCSYGIHAETEALVNIQQHRSILVNCLAYTFGQGDRTFRFSVLHRNRSEEHTSELQSLAYLVCRLLLEKKKKNTHSAISMT